MYYDVPDIDAVIISHYHADHIADIGVFQHARVVYAHVAGQDDLLPIYGHKEDETEFEKLTDRKSTRLNSSHVAISYAVFCLKKKKEKHNTTLDSTCSTFEMIE